jgi:hypothetical protein
MVESEPPSTRSRRCSVSSASAGTAAVTGSSRTSKAFAAGCLPSVPTHPHFTAGERNAAQVHGRARRCSKQHRIIVAGSRSSTLMMGLHQRGYYGVETIASCGAPRGQYDVALVDWRGRSIRALAATLDWLVHFLASSAILVVWIDSRERAGGARLQSVIGKIRLSGRGRYSLSRRVRPCRVPAPYRASVPHHSSETIRMDNGEQATPPLSGSRGTSWLLIQEARLHWRCIGLALGRRAAPLSGSHPIRVALLLLSSTGKERALRAHRI